MLKVALVGANGQVGAELCLLLAERKDLYLVPICRNRSGSAFLRWHGIACRHGRVADPSDAPRLLSDCDVVVNSSLATGTPSQIRRTEARIVRNLFDCSKRTATVIHFSTQSVYGDPRPGRRVRWRNPYGRAKLATEHQMRLKARITPKPAFILRLGHVCGAMQEISNTIRTEIRAQRVLLPSRDLPSNTVYTAAIVNAIDQIIARRTQPGTYDLMNTPRWTWRQVYEFEAAACGVPLAPRIAGSTTLERKGILFRAARALAAVSARKSARDLISKAFAYAPESANARAVAWWYKSRVRGEIAQLGQREELAEHLSYVENGRRFFPAERITMDLLEEAAPKCARCPDESVAWPADLPDAHDPVTTKLIATPAPD